MIKTICISVAVTAVLVPFIKALCEHYEPAERQKRIRWKNRQKIVAPEQTQAAKIAAFVALPAAERQALNDNFWVALIPFFGLLLFFFHPILATLCLPFTLASLVVVLRMKQAPLGAPSEEEIFRAEMLKRLK